MAGKKEFTEEQMRDFCNDMLPLLNHMEEILVKHGVESGVRVYLSDNYLTLDGSGLGGWELQKFGGEYEMRFEKRVALYREEGVEKTGTESQVEPLKKKNR